MSDPTTPRSSFTRPLALVLAAILVCAGLAGVFLLRRGEIVPAQTAAEGLPAPGSDVYREMVSAFYEGVAALDADAVECAKAALARATDLIPGEPAAWADLALLKLRLGDYDGAAADLERARALAPDSGAIARLLGLLESRRGQFAEAITHLRRAVELDAGDLKSRFALVKEVERQADPDSDAEALRLAVALSELLPDNVVVLLERARLAAKQGESQTLGDTVERLGKLAPSWPSKAQEIYGELEQAAKTNPRAAATRVVFLRNLLLPTLPFRQALTTVETPVGTVGEPITKFLKLAQPPLVVAAPDEALTFTVEPTGEAGPTAAVTIVATPLTGDGPTTLFAADAESVRRLDKAGTPLPFPGRPGSPPSAHGVLAIDWNSDYLLDLVLAGAGGLKVYQQKEDGTFTDVTAATKLDPAVLGADLFGAWAADVEMDGDLDLVLGARSGKTTVLRNNGDGSFTAIDLFGATTDLRDFVWADLDGDGDPDAALLDAKGGLRIESNERAGKYQPRTAPEGLAALTALAVADLNGDGAVDLLAMRADGTVLQITDRDEGKAWDTVEAVRSPGAVGDGARLLVADLDNNGAPDLIGWGSSGGWIQLADGKGGFRASTAPAGLSVFAVADLNDDGRLDLAGLAENGQPARGLGRGSKDYHCLVVRPRGAKTFGDGRINSFGLGGEVQVRAGLLVQKQVITGPILHFGLGENLGFDIARIVWPNGTMQTECHNKADLVLPAEQRLKGSCPFLYAFDGTAVRFVTDFIWRSPLGLRINAQDTAGVAQTEDWVKIRGDQLAAKDGFYDVRITAELWETHYWDHASLMVVDHPSGTEVIVDERFARQPPRLAVHSTGPLHPVASARDDQGRDVTAAVAARDGRYLDDFGRGFYQGVTRDHWVEVEIGDDVPRDRPLKLVAYGWIHPTDSSINVAIGQGTEIKPQGLILEVPTPDGGGWKVARDDLGFPAGKNKTILVDLDGLFAPGAPRRLRLRTNLEIFWDSLAVAEAAPETTLKTQRLAPESAEFRRRGYSLMTQANASSPELPDYGTLGATGQPWRDLIGYYTRYGDVRELLEKVDDRYVIANAGDELALRFPAPPPPPSGWVRDFVVIGDGWNKDGDYNTAFSKTVLPLPSHTQTSYDAPPGALEDDPVYRLHPDDWRQYHTRYVTPSDFQYGIRPRLENRPARKSESKP
ncbi:MAG: FG-GAP-like repeat-containing protein [Paludisphaera borealis]|uniref:FG-GAP-like repeat-containing protein n=1 Tax=Paludisphaera borealis TaxID=1387353 RepID=UPI00284BE8DE|nr:FG-GAP-like repeat-containing protein [Paludisphaera borealis]MDR3617730.1 FG-GAP-like repeat-containing protein [Paludisphaera borealis]